MDTEKAFSAFKEQKTNALAQTSETIETKLNEVYRTLRTMSLLPGVRSIDRYGVNFEGDAKKTVQQLYNNAYTSIQLSEIYILPPTLDPHKLDPKTGKNEEPIVTFDELIVETHSTPNINQQSKVEQEEEKKQFEEIEIYEYELMKEQLSTLAQKFPTNTTFNALEVPLLSGQEVITCDNSEFTETDFKNKNDYPRIGIVFTVPV